MPRLWMGCVKIVALLCGKAFLFSVLSTRCVGLFTVLSINKPFLRSFSNLFSQTVSTTKNLFFYLSYKKLYTFSTPPITTTTCI